MIETREAPIATVAEALHEVTSSVGLELDDLLALLMEGVKVTELLDYARAVTSNRLS